MREIKRRETLVDRRHPSAGSFYEFARMRKEKLEPVKAAVAGPYTR